MSVNLNSKQQTIHIAKDIASKLKKNSIVLLYGDLGSGKTFIAREIIKFFCGDNVQVTSPTFNILQIYNCDVTIYHYDLYRLKYSEEIFELSFEEALDNKICIIEWPEIIETLIPKPYIRINLSLVNNLRSCVIQNIE